jgi:hypothetical protein
LCSGFLPQVLEEGSIASEKIDSDKLIDQHYYAIASKVCLTNFRLPFSDFPFFLPTFSVTTHSFSILTFFGVLLAVLSQQATILKPHELNVPADKFKGQFGLSWQAALDSGKVCCTTKILHFHHHHHLGRG